MILRTASSCLVRWPLQTRQYQPFPRHVSFHQFSSSLRFLSSSYHRQPSPEFSSDFSHHDPNIARLNHGSFGATPAPVIKAEELFRARWRANPDAFYFGQILDSELQTASHHAANVLHSKKSKKNTNININKELPSVALVENATVAATSIARRWASHQQYGDNHNHNHVVMCLDVAYKAVELGLRHICGSNNVHVANVIKFEEAMSLPLPKTLSCERPELTDDAILRRLDDELHRIQPSYVILDHISSQPALRLPVKQMVELCRSHSCQVQEIAVDAAHAIGMVDIDVIDINADFYFTNLHKWAFTAGPVCALHIRNDAEVENSNLQLHKTAHAIPSWRIGEGIVSESLWAGTRDYAADASVPVALDYLNNWRNVDGLNSISFNRTGYIEAANELRDAWGVNDPNDPAVVQLDYFAEAMGMIRLPPKLNVGDAKPGQPSGGVRQMLREKYGIEAAIGNFGKAGAFLRLSHAVYTTDNDIQRLRDAIYQISFH